MKEKTLFENNVTKSISRIVALCASLILSLSLVGIIVDIGSASAPENGSGQGDGRVIGMTSNALECLAIGNDLPVKTSGVIKLTWQGQVKRARLVLNVAGTEAAHSIKVNGQPVALAPIYPGGQPCSDEEYFYLDISPEVLVQGDNLIEITDDALAGDSWTAANVRLEVFGDVTAWPLGRADSTGQIGVADVTAATSTFIFTFTNSYDGSSQEAMAQIPDSYDGNTPTPLLIFAHGRTGVMEEGIDVFGDVANDKGWLLASPEMHGSWKPDPSCYDPSVNCDHDDEVLTEQGKPGAFAYASLESQYDVIGTVKYMVNNYNVKRDQIYPVGYSMGGQIATVTAAKYPHIFAAVFDNKGPTDMDQWYYENNSYYRRTMRKECHIGGEQQDPTQNPFCYERRSSVNFASNYIHVPISMTHSISDVSVPIHHSRDLRDAINSYGPDQPVLVFEDTAVGPMCPPNYHCYEPDPMAVLDFLEQYTLNNNPTHISITTDESKSYHWLNITQTGGDHWSEVEAAYSLANETVTATISDTRPLTLALNLGSTPIIGPESISRPGMGLPATTYLVKGGGNYKLEDYTSGYLTTVLTTTDQFSLTISAIGVEVSANPSIVRAGQMVTSTITVVVKDRLNNPVPDDTTVEFSTTEGIFPNASSTYTTPTTGGQATTTLTLDTDDNSAQVLASVGSVTDSTTVKVIVAEIYLPIILKNS